jgi:hypothetical protein
MCVHGWYCRQGLTKVPHSLFSCTTVSVLRPKIKHKVWKRDPCLSRGGVEQKATVVLIYFSFMWKQPSIQVGSTNNTAVFTQQETWQYNKQCRNKMHVPLRKEYCFRSQSPIAINRQRCTTNFYPVGPQLIHMTKNKWEWASDVSWRNMKNSRTIWWYMIYDLWFMNPMTQSFKSAYRTALKCRH